MTRYPDEDSRQSGNGRSGNRGDVIRQSANIIALVVTIFFNVLAVTLPLAGRTTEAIADSFRVLVIPAGYVFSIWSLIYTALAVFVVYQALPSQRDNPRLRRVGYLFVASCAFNVLWLFAWHNLQIGLSLVLMLALLTSLILIYERLGIGKGKAPGTNPSSTDVSNTNMSRAEAWAVRAPFSLYLGWITVATVTNVGVFFYTLGWQGGARFWAAVAIFAAAGIGALLMARRRDVIFNLVLIWAFIGIAIKYWDLSLVVNSALLAAALVAAWLVYRSLESPASNQSQPAG